MQTQSEPVEPAEAAPHPTSKPHFPCFDGLRTIAVLAAILQHVSFTTGAAVTAPYRRFVAHYEVGPVLFFMISGFLLYRAFVSASFAGRSTQKVVPFLRRRALRVLPGFWVAVVVIVGVHSVRGNHGFGEMTLSGPGDVLRLATLTQIYSTHTFFRGITQAWTLATEIGFYLFLPVYAFVLRRVTKRLRPDGRLLVELIGVTALYVIGFVWRYWVYHRTNLWLVGRLPVVAEYWLPGFLDVFALGMGLAAVSVWSAQRETQPAWLEKVGQYAGVGVVLAIAAYLVMALGLHLPVGTTRPMPGPALWRNALNGITAFFLVLPAVFGPQQRGVFRRLMQLRPVAYLGLVSFGVYLYHEAWMNQAREWQGAQLFRGDFVSTLTICVALALLSAAISYRVIERPFLELKDKPLRSLWPNPWKST